MRCGGRSRISSPCRRTVPASGVNMPDTRLYIVVFPAPFGPISAWTSPVWMTRLASATARMPPKCFATASTSSTVPWRAAGRRNAGSGRPSWIAPRVHRRGFLRRRTPAPLQLRPDADEPARRVQHEADEHQPEPEQPVARPHREQLAEQDVEERPQRRPEDVVHAADHHHRQQLAGEGHRDRLRRNEVVLEAEERAGEPGHHRREDECRQLVPLDGITLERGALLVLADRHEHVPERRADDAQQAVQHAERDQGDDRVVDERVVEGDRTDAAAREAAETVLAAGDLGPAEGDGVGERRERERQQREVHAAPTQDEDAHDGGERGDEHHREQDRDRDLVVEPVLLDERGGIGADAEPGAVAEGREPGEPDEQVEAHRRDGEDHHHRGRVHRQADHAHDERQGDERDRPDQERAVLPARPGGRHSNFSMRSPSRPRGRNSSTRNISTYIDASPAAGTKWMVIAAHHADQERGEHHAPEAAQPADHDHDEGDGDDLRAHGRMHHRDRREQRAAERGHADAEHHDRGHVGLQADPERRHHVGPLDAGAHDAAEGRPVQQQPDAGQHDRHHGEQQQPIAREEEIAEHDLALQPGRHRRGQGRRAPDHADRLLGHQREPEGDQQRQDRVGGVEAAQDEALEEDPEQRHRDRRQDHRRAEAEVLRDLERGVGAEGVERAVSEVHHAADAEDQRQAERDQEVVAPEHEAVQHLFEQEQEFHGQAGGTADGGGAAGAAASGPPTSRRCSGLSTARAARAAGSARVPPRPARGSPTCPSPCPSA